MTRPIPYSVALALGLPFVAACSSQPAADLTVHAPRAKDVESLPGAIAGEESAPAIGVSGQGPTTTTTEAEGTTTTIVASAPATSNETVVVFEASPAPVVETDDSWWQGQPGYDGSMPLPPAWIMERESHGDYSAVNESSGAGGAWQFLPDTWNGYGGYARAEDAPPAVQDQAAAELWDNGAGCAAWAAC
jgi:hypothetical protein